MKKYFVYELKRNLFVIGMLTIAAAIIYVTPLLLGEGRTLMNNVGLASISAIGGILAAVMPVWLFSYRMKKRSVDLFYSLPLSHTKILVTKFLFGLVAIFIPYTVAYWLGAFAVVSKVYYAINPSWYFAQYFGSIIPIYIIYALSSFIFTRANNTLDGAIFIIFWTLAAVLVVYAILSFLPTDYCRYLDKYTGIYFDSDRCAFYFFPFKPLDRLTVVMSGRIVKNYAYEYICNAEKATMIVSFLLYALLAAGATAELILSEKRAKAENAGQISDSWFGYKTMLPLFTFFILVIANIIESLSELTLVIMYIVGMFAVTILYKRNIKIGKKQAIIFAVSVFAGIIFSIIRWSVVT